MADNQPTHASAAQQRQSLLMAADFLPLVQVGKPVMHERHKRRYAKYRCQCGVEFDARVSDVKTGRVRSCGCAFKRASLDVIGAAKHPLFKTWNHMLLRCFDSNNKSYPNYGGRGITVCERWAASFKAFCDDMGVRPSADYSIDRINNDGNYEPGNCRWATRTQQRQNSRGVVKIGEQTVCELAAAMNVVPVKLATLRLRKGWTLDRAVSVPSKRATWQPIVAIYEGDEVMAELKCGCRVPYRSKSKFSKSSSLPCAKHPLIETESEVQE